MIKNLCWIIFGVVVVFDNHIALLNYAFHNTLLGKDTDFTSLMKQVITRLFEQEVKQFNVTPFIRRVT